MTERKRKKVDPSHGGAKEPDIEVDAKSSKVKETKEKKPEQTGGA